MSANGAADSALAVADLLDCFNQSWIIFIAPGGQKLFVALLRATGARGDWGSVKMS